MPKIDAIAATVQELSVPGTKPKDIIAAARERHPGASKKDIVRAAFFALTGGVDGNLEKAKRIHELAITERLSIDDAPSELERPKKRKRKAEADASQA